MLQYFVPACHIFDRILVRFCCPSLLHACGGFFLHNMTKKKLSLFPISLPLLDYNLKSDPLNCQSLGRHVTTAKLPPSTTHRAKYFEIEIDLKAISVPINGLMKEDIAAIWPFIHNPHAHQGSSNQSSHFSQQGATVKSKECLIIFIFPKA